MFYDTSSTYREAYGKFFRSGTLLLDGSSSVPFFRFRSFEKSVFSGQHEVEHVEEHLVIIGCTNNVPAPSLFSISSEVDTRNGSLPENFQQWTVSCVYFRRVGKEGGSWYIVRSFCSFYFLLLVSFLFARTWLHNNPAKVFPRGQVSTFRCSIYLFWVATTVFSCSSPAPTPEKSSRLRRFFVDDHLITKMPTQATLA